MEKSKTNKKIFQKNIFQMSWIKIFSFIRFVVNTVACCKSKSYDSENKRKKHFHLTRNWAQRQKYGMLSCLEVLSYLVQVSWVLSPRQRATSNKGMLREREVVFLRELQFTTNQVVSPERIHMQVTYRLSRLYFHNLVYMYLTVIKEK